MSKERLIRPDRDIDPWELLEEEALEPPRRPVPGKISRTHANGNSRVVSAPGKVTLTSHVARRLTEKSRARAAAGRRRTPEDIGRDLAADPGRPLDAATRARYERAFQHSFAFVRVHEGGVAEEAARELFADAFTLGQDIYFARGKLAPGTAEGDRLLLHELSHVVQHAQGRVDADTARVATPSEALEQEAYGNEAALAERLDGGPGALSAGAPMLAPGPLTGPMPGTVSGPAPAQVAGVILRRRGNVPGGDTAESGPVAEGGPEGEDREPTEEELQEMIRQARQEGQAQPEPQAETEAETAPADADAAAQEEGVAAGQEAGPEAESQAGGPEGAQPAALASTPPGPDGALPSFEALKSGSLTNWDEEVAWHDYFAGGGGPSAGVTIDRGALIASALGEGLLGGFQAGAQALAIDTAINMASSKIPYLQGFVEMARIAYDPAAWFEGQSQATVGKIATGLDQIWNGDIIDKMEGVVNVLDGVNGFIGLASTICWIVAAAGFVISFICPAVFPFVALAANWAVTLGTISTLIGVYISLARLGVMAARAAEIALSEADPAELLAKGERLRAQSQMFGQEFTQRAGNRLRDRAQGALQNRHAARSNPTQTSRSNRSSGTQPTRMQRIRQVMSGAGRLALDTADAGLGVSKARGGGDELSINVGIGRAAREAKGKGSLIRVTQAYMGRGRYGDQGRGNTRQRLADMEDAGATVFHNEGSRSRVNNAMRDRRGEGTPVNRQRQELITTRAQEQARHDEVVRRSQEAAEQAQRIKGSAEEAQQRLAQTRAEHGDTIAAAETNLRAQQDLHQAAQQVLQHNRTALDGLRAQHRQALEAGDATQAASLRDAVTLMERRVHAGEASVEQIRHNVRIAEHDVTIARNPVDVAEARAAGTQQGAALSEEDARTAAAAVGPSNDRLNEAKVKVNLHNLPGGQRLDDAEALAKRSAGYRLITDFTGTGRNDLLGHNKGAGSTGAGTSLISEVIDGVGRQGDQEEAGGDAHGGFLGTWSRTGQLMNDPDAELDLIGNAGARGEGEDYVGQLQARYEQLQAALPPPPMEGPDRIDGARAAYSAIDEEQRQIEFQQQVIGGLLEESNQSISALEAVHLLSEANQEAVAVHQGELDTRLTAQDDLEQCGGDMLDNASEAQSEGEQGSSMLEGFFDKFLELMGMIPSELVDNAGEGTAAVNGISDGLQEQGQSAQETEQAGQSTVREAQRMRQETEAAQAGAETANQELVSTDQAISEEQLAAMDGIAFLEQTQGSAEERLAAITQEKERLRGDHATAEGEMTSWIAAHEAIRQEGLGDLDGLVELADPQGGDQEG